MVSKPEDPDEGAHSLSSVLTNTCTQKPVLSSFLLLNLFVLINSYTNENTQAQHERADNCALRAENDKIRCENIAIREALKNVICPACGVPPLNEDSYFDEHKLRMENAQLKEEVFFL